MRPCVRRRRPTRLVRSCRVRVSQGVLELLALGRNFGGLPAADLDFPDAGPTRSHIFVARSYGEVLTCSERLLNASSRILICMNLSILADSASVMDIRCVKDHFFGPGGEFQEGTCLQGSYDFCSYYRRL